MSQRIKIVSVFHEIGWAGDESRTLSMSRTMDHERFEHMVLTILDPSAEAESYGFNDREKQYADMGVQVRDLSKEIPERIPRLRGLPGKLYAKTGVLRRAKRLARFVRQWGADVIDARTAAGLVGVLAGKMAGTPTAVTFYHGPLHCRETSWPWTTRLALRLADRVLTDSEVRAKQFRAQLPGSEHKVFAIPNGIPEPQSAYHPEEARKLFGLPEDPRVRVIGQIGRLIESKGQTVLLRAAKKIIDQDPHAAFLIVGYTYDQHYREGLNRLAQELGIANRVRIVSYPGPIGDVWKAIDIHAHASLFDSQPISVIEGMSLGKPAVVTSVGGVPEMVEHGHTGLIVPPGDANALSVSILELLKNQDLARRLGQGARERYEQRHRPEMMTRALEELFLGMVNRLKA